MMFCVLWIVRVLLLIRFWVVLYELDRILMVMLVLFRLLGS